MSRMWEHLQASQLIEEFGRQEPEALSHAPPPPQAQFDALFSEPATQCKVTEDGTHEEIAAQRQLQKWLAVISKVATDESFVGQTPASEQELTSEVQLLRVHFRNAGMGDVDNAWQAGLLPEGEVVQRKKDSLTAIVLRSYSTAALFWPAKQVGLRVWTADLEVQELRWVVCFDVAVFEVIPCAWASPLHLVLKDIMTMNHARGVWYDCGRWWSPRLVSLWCSAMRRLARVRSVALGACSAHVDDTCVDVRAIMCCFPSSRQCCSASCQGMRRPARHVKLACSVSCLDAQ